MKLKALYTTCELAAMSGLSRHQVGRLLKRHDVYTIKNGRIQYIPLSALRMALPWIVDSAEEADSLSFRMGR